MGNLFCTNLENKEQINNISEQTKYLFENLAPFEYMYVPKLVCIEHVRRATGIIARVAEFLLLTLSWVSSFVVTAQTESMKKIHI